jgi:hypothetical protein
MKPRYLVIGITFSTIVLIVFFYCGNLLGVIQAKYDERNLSLKYYIVGERMPGDSLFAQAYFHWADLRFNWITDTNLSHYQTSYIQSYNWVVHQYLIDAHPYKKGEIEGFSDIKKSYRFSTGNNKQKAVIDKKGLSKLNDYFHELSLTSDISDSSGQIFRFYWLRSFDDPICIHLNINLEGNGSIVAKRVCSLRKDCTPVDTAFRVNLAAGEIDKRMTGYNFWEDDLNHSFPHSDGAAWILEGKKSPNYHVAVYEGFENSPFIKLCLCLLELSNIKVDPKRIY